MYCFVLLYFVTLCSAQRSCITARGRIKSLETSLGNATATVAVCKLYRAQTCVCSPQELQEEDQVSHRSSTSRLSRSPLKKVKIMQCKVTLLDGSDYTLDVEVRGRSSLLMGTRRHEHLQDWLWLRWFLSSQFGKVPTWVRVKSYAQTFASLSSECWSGEKEQVTSVQCDDRSTFHFQIVVWN